MKDIIYFYNQTLYFEDEEHAKSAERRFFGEEAIFDFANLLLYFGDESVDVLGHETGDECALQFQTEEPLNEQTQAILTTFLVPECGLHHASYNVPFDISYAQYQACTHESPTSPITDVAPINDSFELVTRDDHSVEIRPAQEDHDGIELSASDGHHLMRLLQGIYTLEPAGEPVIRRVKLSGWARLLTHKNGTFTYWDGATRVSLDNYHATRLMYALLAELQPEDNVS